MTPISKEVFVIEGLGGSVLPKGKVNINGAKNAALKAMAAAILFDGPVTLHNVPQTADVATMAHILKKLGVKVSNSKEGMVIDSADMKSADIDSDLGESMRASVVLTGPLLGRFGKVSFPAPGGCVIGARPIDMFLKGYELMGAKVSLMDSAEKYVIEAGGDARLKSAEIFFHMQAVGPTETLMMAATLAKGTTVLKNCAMEPEIGNVAEWLIRGGARISGVGTPTLTIEGTDGKLLSSSAVSENPYTAIPDRIEAGSFVLLGALLSEELTVQNCEPRHLESLVESLRLSGVSISCGKDSITVKRPEKFSAFNARTHEYPGFPTDLQAPLVTFLTQAHGDSTIVETIFEGRFKYVEELQKMGAQITIMNPREILVKGPSQLSELPDDEELRAHDIRAGFAIVMAALAGKGKFTVNNVHLIDRGYERLEEKLKKIGAKVERV